MNIRFLNQPKDVTLDSLLNIRLKGNFKKIWIVAGMTKDSGFDMIFDSIEIARKNGIEVNAMIGIDRKNTSKDMLMKLLKLGCNLFVHINRDDKKVETRIYVFENDEGESFIYESCGKFSEGGLSSNYCLIQEVSYLAEDKKAYEKFKTTLLQGAQDIFKQVGEEEVKLLAEKGEIVTRIIDRKIPRINELYGNGSMLGNDNSFDTDVYDENNSKKLFDIKFDNEFDIDIDIDVGGEIKKSEFSAESEAKIEKEKRECVDRLADEKLAKLYEDEISRIEDKKACIIKDVSDINFDDMKIFVMEINKIIEKGTGEGEIRIPRSLYDNVKDFFGNDFRTITDDKGKERLAVSLKLGILDVRDGGKYEDTAILYDTGKCYALKSLVFRSLQSNEGDIVRFIKIADGNFELELIRKDVKEYDIWNVFCKHTMKNSKRRFGVM